MADLQVDVQAAQQMQQLQQQAGLQQPIVMPGIVGVPVTLAPNTTTSAPSVQTQPTEDQAVYTR